MELSSSLVFMRRIVVCGLLLAGFSLPMAAWAVDTDGDGVDDSVDAFPNNTEATSDTDGDGAPNTINNSLAPVVFSDSFNGTAFQSGWSGGSGYWTVSGGYAVWGARSSYSGTVGRVFDIPGGGQLSFRHQRLTTNGSGNLRVDLVTANTLYTSASWVQTTVNLPEGSHSVGWSGNCANSSFSFPCVQFDDVVLRASSLTLDKFDYSAAASVDTDNDGFPDSWNASCNVSCQANSGLLIDNCPTNANPDQLDTDGDLQGNVCDVDDDNDGDLDGSDNCPVHHNSNQLDTDGDLQGNVCDADDDNDGDLDGSDNCPVHANSNQVNTDGDSQGDVCDTDDDNDGVLDASDAFPLNPAESLDTDNDGIGNNADLDDDNDGLPDVMDPLPLQAKFNLNVNYKGSTLKDSANLQ